MLFESPNQFLAIGVIFKKPEAMGRDLQIILTRRIVSHIGDVIGK
jgi:hypothetical protein